LVRVKVSPPRLNTGAKPTFGPKSSQFTHCRAGCGPSAHGQAKWAVKKVSW